MSSANKSGPVKMRGPVRGSSALGSRLLFAFLIAFSFIFLIIHSGNSVRVYKNIVYHIISPASIGISSLLAYSGRINTRFTNLINAYAELEKRQAERAELHDLRARYTSLLKEVKEYSFLIGDSQLRRKLIPVEVISRDSSGWYQSVILRNVAGTGVGTKMPVLMNKNGRFFIIGRISEVFPDFSKLMLITGLDSFLYARSVNTGKDGLITGRGGSTLYFRYVDQDSRLEQGEEIYTASFSDYGFPEIYIGTVKSGPEMDNGFHYYEVTPGADFSSLDQLVCVSPTVPAPLFRSGVKTGFRQQPELDMKEK